MRSNYSLKRLFSMLVIKVVVSTIGYFAIMMTLWLVWLSVFPRNYYEKDYSEYFLKIVENRMPNLLAGEKLDVRKKESKFQYLITVDGQIQTSSQHFPNKGVKLNTTSTGTHSFVENNKMYAFKTYAKYPSVKILMIYPAFSTGNQLIDHINVVFQYFIIVSPFVMFIVFLSFFTRRLYQIIRLNFRIIETHLVAIEDGDLSKALPDFNDREFSELARRVNKMRIELKKSLDDTQKESIMQKQLFASIAHDVRTPLTIINAETELIELVSKDVNIQERCAVVTSEVSRIDQLLTELLRITRLNTDRNNLNYEALNIISLLHATILAFTSLCKPKGIRIKEIYNDQQSVIYGDRLMVTRVIQNILSNAVEHADINGNIECAVIHNGSESIVTISNTGSLFSEAYLKNAFVPFYSSQLQREKEHFGLGLYMANLMLKKMNGSMTIKNENQRAMVYIVLKNS